MTLRLLPLLVLTLVATDLQRGGQRHFLDLSDPALRVSREGLPVRGACFGEGGNVDRGPRSLPLRISFSGVNATSYQRAERVTYDVTITNEGKAPVTVPWLPSQALGDRPADRVLMASIGLHAQDEQGRDLRFAPGLLEGSPDVPKSTVVLAQGDTAVIRVQGRLEAIGEGIGGLRTPLGRELKMTAVFRLTTAPCRWIDPIASTNAVTLRIQPATP